MYSIAKNTPSALGTEIRAFDENPAVVFTFSKYAETGYAWLNYNDETGFACSNQIRLHFFRLVYRYGRFRNSDLFKHNSNNNFGANSICQLDFQHYCHNNL